MKTFKDKKGFTLIELLAVIVVLAIVTALAMTTMLPLMNKAIKSGFVDEANAARETASDVMTLIGIGSFDEPEAGSDFQVSSDGNKLCISLKLMAKKGLYEKDIEYFNKKNDQNPEYEGKVIVTKSGESSNNYSYKIVMHNDRYYVSKDGKVSENDVNDFNSQEGFDCTTTDVEAP